MMCTAARPVRVSQSNTKPRAQKCDDVVSGCVAQLNAVIGASLCLSIL